MRYRRQWRQKDRYARRLDKQEVAVRELALNEPQSRPEVNAIVVGHYPREPTRPHHRNEPHCHRQRCEH